MLEALGEPATLTLAAALALAERLGDAVEERLAADEAVVVQGRRGVDAAAAGSLPVLGGGQMKDDAHRGRW